MAPDSEKGEQKVAILVPPTLSGLGSDVVYRFRDEYERYVAIRKADRLEPMPLRECLDKALLEVLETTRPAVVKTDTALDTYLREKTQFPSLQEAMRHLSSLVMDLSIADMDQRLMSYDMAFLSAINKRMTKFPLQEKVKIECYAKGLRPDALRMHVQDLTLLVGGTMASVMTAAADWINVHGSLAPDDYASPDQDVSERIPSHPSRDVLNVPLKEEKEYLTRSKGDICRRCGVTAWTPEHWNVCKNAPPPNSESVSSRK